MIFIVTHTIISLIPKKQLIPNQKKNYNVPYDYSRTDQKTKTLNEKYRFNPETQND